MKKLTFLFAVSAFVLIMSATAGFADVKTNLTDNLQEVTYSVSDCL